MAAQRKYEAPELASAIGRMVDALTVRAAEGDLEAVEVLAKLAGDVPEALGMAVAGARSTGYSWAAIAGAVNTSRQNAFQRFGHFLAPDLVPAPCGLPKLTQRAAAAHARICRDCRRVAA